MITFFWPWCFLLLPLPLLLPLTKKLFPSSLCLNKSVTSPDVAALKLPTYKVISLIISEKDFKSFRRHDVLFPWLIWILFIISVAQPLWLDKKQAFPVTGRDLMLLIDVSGSMRQMDFKPIRETSLPQGKLKDLSTQNINLLENTAISRLELVKEVATEFVQQRKGDRIGLILFGNRPYLRAALSYDRNAIEQLIMESEIALAGESTAIGDAIGLAIKRLRHLPAKSRVIILLTDGANNEGMINPGKAAQFAAEQGIRIYTIALGKKTIPGPNPYGVWSVNNAQRFEASVLKSIAELTGGFFFHAADSQGLLEAYKKLNELEPALNQNIEKQLARSLYPWTLAIALILAMWRILSYPSGVSEFSDA